MVFIRERALAGELLFGFNCNLGSSMTTEMVARAGFDWVWIDMEHGVGDHDALVLQLQAVEGTGAASVVRIAWNDAPRFKRVLDLGASGVMVPYVNTPEEAARAAAAMRYPPAGVRGVAKFTRAAGFAQDFDRYFREANENLLTVVQIETPEALENADAIASVDGVDVLFVGPLDLSTNLGIQQQYDHDRFTEALRAVAQACKRHGKAAGILLPGTPYLDPWIALGYSFLVVGSEGGALAAGMRTTLAECRKRKGPGHA